jgi:phytoene/squalene synthetase
MTTIEHVEQQASGSSFYTAMRLLPPLERTAIFAVYAFCREVDDIADSGVGTVA